MLLKPFSFSFYFFYAYSPRTSTKSGHKRNIFRPLNMNSVEIHTCDLQLQCLFILTWAQYTYMLAYMYIHVDFFSFINPLTIIIALCGCLRQQLGGLAWSRRDCWLLREVKLSSGCVGRQVGVPQPITSCKINWQLMGCENVYLACNKRGLYANKCSSITAEMRINALKGSLKAHINS